MLGRAVDGLEVVATQRRPDAACEGREDTVFVNVTRLCKPAFDLAANFLEFAAAPRLRQCRVELQLELADEATRQVRMRDEHVFHVVLAEGQPELQYVFCVTAQQDDFVPGQAGCHDQSIESVVLSLAREHGHEAFFETIRYGIDVDGGIALVAQVEVLDEERFTVMQPGLVRVLGIDVTAHLLEDRQRFGQRDRRISRIHDEAHIAGFEALGLVQVDAAVDPVLQHLVHRADVAAGFSRQRFCLVAGREDVAVGPVQPTRFVIIESLEKLRVQAIRPGDDELGELLLQFLNADARALALRRAHDNVHARQCRLGNLHGRVHRDAAEGVFQQCLDPAANRRHVFLSRHEHEAGEETLERIASQEQLDALAILQVQDTERRACEIADARLEQLFARIGLDDVR